MMELSWSMISEINIKNPFIKVLSEIINIPILSGKLDGILTPQETLISTPFLLMVE